MSEAIRKSMKQALIAFHIHSPPEKVVQDLSVETATKKVSKNTHTIWDLLHHIVFWQDITLDAIDDKEVDWERSKTENWPSRDDDVDQSKLDSMIKRFLDGISAFSERVDSVDLDSNMKAWPQGTKIWALQMIAQHNSYHLGQIITLRQILGDWQIE